MLQNSVLHIPCTQWMLPTIENNQWAICQVYVSFWEIKVEYLKLDCHEKYVKFGSWVTCFHFLCSHFPAPSVPYILLKLHFRRLIIKLHPMNSALSSTRDKKLKWSASFILSVLKREAEAERNLWLAYHYIVTNQELSTLLVYLLEDSGILPISIGGCSLESNT